MDADRDLATRLLSEAVADDPRGKAGVAARLAVSRVLLARVCSPKDKTGVSAKLARRVIDAYHVIPECPATSLPQPRRECLRLSADPVPTHNPLAMRIWKCCQSCPHNPKTAPEEK